jgi:hypothetical protein
MAKTWSVEDAANKVTQIYQRVLERSVDTSGLITWGGVLSRGEESVRDVVRHLGHSQEYRDRFITPLSIADAVGATYQHFLARNADPGGLQTFERVAEVRGFDAVVDDLVGSQEYTNRFGDDNVPE